MMTRLLRAILLVLAFLSLAGLAAAAEAAEKTVPLPAGMVLPVRVHLSVRILDIVKIAETTGEMAAVVEYAARWNDPSQRFNPADIGSNHRDFAGAQAEGVLSEIWTPGLAVENQIGTGRSQTAAVSIASNGDVELIVRLDADFRVVNDLSAFPFDRQNLVFSFVSRYYPADETVFVVDDRDRALSSFASRLTASDWSAGALLFSAQHYYGWNAKPFMRMNVTGVVERAWARYFLRIFVPFVAVLSVSVFILWAPKEAIRDAVGITYSALLALAALSFTFESSFPGSMSVNSPIAFMISLGYFYLIFILLVELILASGWGLTNSGYPFLAKELRRYVRFALPALFTIICVCTILRSSA